jgi:hypothetical protein
VNKPNLLTVVLAVIITNAAGLLLRYFNIDTHIILVGFRFHLSAVLPLLLIFRSCHQALIKECFVKPQYKKIFPYLIWTILPAGVLFVLLYFTKNIELGDPEYFYEFGISSIIDYPIYLFWNAPQLFMVFLFLVLSTEGLRFKFVTILFLSFFLFTFELVPIGIENINYFDIGYIDIGSLFALSLITGIVIKFFRNIYFFSFLVFSILWLSLLAFGSSSEKMVNILFAAQYQNWEGFFEVNKEYTDYLLVVHLTFLLVFILFSALLRKK